MCKCHIQIKCLNKTLMTKPMSMCYVFFKGGWGEILTCNLIGFREMCENFQQHSGWERRIWRGTVKSRHDAYLSRLLQQLGNSVDDVRLLRQQTFLSAPMVGLAHTTLVSWHHLLNCTLGCTNRKIPSFTQPLTRTTFLQETMVRIRGKYNFII